MSTRSSGTWWYTSGRGARPGSGSSTPPTAPPCPSTSRNPRPPSGAGPTPSTTRRRSATTTPPWPPRGPSTTSISRRARRTSSSGSPCSGTSTPVATGRLAGGPRPTTEPGCRSRWSTVPTWSPIRRREPAGAPCLLYGYGSYEASMDPMFSSLRLSLLDRGFVFAIAHVRGGGEMGRTWYERGKLAAKPNTFTDFVACARTLIAGGWTAPDRLVARGGSAGGLLMGAVANLAPESVPGHRGRGPLRRLPDHDPGRDPAADRARVGGVGQPGRRTPRSTGHEVVLALRQRPRRRHRRRARPVPGHPGHGGPVRPPGRGSGSRPSGWPSCGRPIRRTGCCSRPSSGPATAGPRAATTHGRTRRSSTPSSSTPWAWSMPPAGGRPPG